MALIITTPNPVNPNLSNATVNLDSILLTHLPELPEVQDLTIHGILYPTFDQSPEQFQDYINNNFNLNIYPKLKKLTYYGAKLTGFENLTCITYKGDESPDFTDATNLEKLIVTNSNVIPTFVKTLKVFKSPTGVPCELLSKKTLETGSIVGSDIDLSGYKKLVNLELTGDNVILPVNLKSLVLRSTWTKNIPQNLTRFKDFVNKYDLSKLPRDVVELGVKCNMDDDFTRFKNLKNLDIELDGTELPKIPNTLTELQVKVSQDVKLFTFHNLPNKINKLTVIRYNNTFITFKGKWPNLHELHIKISPVEVIEASNVDLDNFVGEHGISPSMDHMLPESLVRMTYPVAPKMQLPELTHLYVSYLKYWDKSYYPKINELWANVYVDKGLDDSVLDFGGMSRVLIGWTESEVLRIKKLPDNIFISCSWVDVKVGEEVYGDTVKLRGDGGDGKGDGKGVTMYLNTQYCKEAYGELVNKIAG